MSNILCFATTNLTGLGSASNVLLQLPSGSSLKRVAEGALNAQSEILENLNLKEEIQVNYISIEKYGTQFPVLPAHWDKFTVAQWDKFTVAQVACMEGKTNEVTLHIQYKNPEAIMKLVNSKPQSQHGEAMTMPVNNLSGKQRGYH
eukprot:gene21250-28163_t